MEMAGPGAQMRVGARRFAIAAAEAPDFMIMRRYSRESPTKLPHDHENRPSDFGRGGELARPAGWCRGRVANGLPAVTIDTPIRTNEPSRGQ
jgi:hypothetical protein